MRNTREVVGAAREAAHAAGGANAERGVKIRPAPPGRLLDEGVESEFRIALPIQAASDVGRGQLASDGMKRAAAGSTVERLARDLVEATQWDTAAEELTAWLAGAPRFRVFVEAHRDKIRKKLRGAAEAEALRDVRVELQAALLLLADRRIDLGYEAYGSGRVGPDFTVTFRATQRFNLEVTRPRRLRGPTDFSAVVAKLRQLPPSTSNAVLIAIDGGSAAALDVAAATRVLRSRADARDEPFLAAHGFEGTRDFYDRYLRLGGVLVWCAGAVGDARAALWINPSARIPLPSSGVRACLRCLRAEIATRPA